MNNHYQVKKESIHGLETYKAPMDDGETRFQTAELSIDWLSSAHPLWQEGSGGNAWSCVPLYSVLREDENIRVPRTGALPSMRLVYGTVEKS